MDYRTTNYQSRTAKYHLRTTTEEFKTPTEGFGTATDCFATCLAMTGKPKTGENRRNKKANGLLLDKATQFEGDKSDFVRHIQ